MASLTIKEDTLLVSIVKSDSSSISKVGQFTFLLDETSTFKLLRLSEEIITESGISERCLLKLD
ncbi:hypothetical protein T05_1483 [Trichinella murrelli]|uniref:Uncharacterized protein n=1 Tax=Trichinella murrelli TaxID=144512 RepID=A0A0V0TXG2_9BILA|nr:hypothetical protein T05_1483 [Trichinella murrelli]